MSHEKLSELCPLYAVGALDGEELREFEIHLNSGCSLCEQQLRESEGLAASLPRALPDITPSHDLKARLFVKLDQEFPLGEVVEFKSEGPSRTTQKTAHKRVWIPWACAAAAGIAVVISLFNVSHLNHEVSSQQARTNELSVQLQALQNQLEEEKSITVFLSRPELRVTNLAGTDKSPQAAGKILWNPRERKALFYAANLPAAPEGKTYQLWIIAGNKPFDAGIFAVDSQGNAFLKVDSLAEAEKAQKFAVTLEPAGGRPQPTGEMHLLGSL